MGQYDINVPKFDVPNILGNYIAGRESTYKMAALQNQYEQTTKLNDLRMRASNGDNSALRELVLYDPNFAKVLVGKSSAWTTPGGDRVDTTTPSAWDMVNKAAGNNPYSAPSAPNDISRNINPAAAPQAYQVQPPANNSAGLPPVDVNQPTVQGATDNGFLSEYNAPQDANSGIAQNIAPQAQEVYNAPTDAMPPLPLGFNPSLKSAQLAQEKVIENTAKAQSIPTDLKLEKGKAQIQQDTIKAPEGYKINYDESGEPSLQKLQGAPDTETQLKKDQADNAKASVTNKLVSLANNYKKLDVMAGITNPDKSAVSNLYRSAADSPLNQWLQAQRGSNEASIRKTILNTQPLLINDIRQASQMGAKGLDSEKELEFYLSAATDPYSGDLKSNLAAIKMLNDSYGLNAKINIDQKYVDKLKKDFLESTKSSEADLTDKGFLQFLKSKNIDPNQLGE